MKTSLLLLTLPLFVFAQTSKPDLKWVDEEVAAIKPPRKGVNTDFVRRLKDPFAAQIALNQPPSDETLPGSAASAEPIHNQNMTLQAIFNGKTALIDGKWYKQDEKIYGYIISRIDHDAVLLQRKKKKLKLSLVTKNDNIKINAK